MEIAHIGDVISFGKGLIGSVEKVNENSVIVQITNGDPEADEPQKTVVNHKRYKIIKN